MMVATTRGWWSLDANMHDGSPLGDSEREHIAQMIKDGYTSGELVRETEEIKDA
jgi:hypothetical protein